MSKSIWNHSHKNSAGVTVREAYFQDEHEAFVLRDIGGKFLSLEDHSEFVYATAERLTPRRWRVTIRDGQTPRQTVVHKSEAIDLILGKN